jgi:hypothetical protein
LKAISHAQVDDEAWLPATSTRWRFRFTSAVLRISPAAMRALDFGLRFGRNCHHG